MGSLAWVGVGVTFVTLTVCAAAEAQSAPEPRAAPPAPGASSAFPPPAPGPGVPPAPSPTAAPSGQTAPAAPPGAVGALAPTAAPPAAPGAFPAPYPGYPGYPPPYPGYPPAPGYGYGYYYGPPPPPPLRYPAHAAASSTPFLDAVVGGVDWQSRFSQFLNLGAQAGVYVGGRLRLTARVVFPTDQVSDSSEFSVDSTSYSIPSKHYSFLWGGSAGIVAVSAPNFVLSPGLLFARSDVSDYGSTLGLTLPFEWVLGSGVRVGFEVAYGRAFGGQYRFDCSAAPCSASSRDRPSGTAFWMQFHFGFGFNHPGPLPPSQFRGLPAR